MLILATFSCTETKSENEADNDPMIGTWNIRLKEIPDEYTHAITLSSTSWSITGNNFPNKGAWHIHGDTLILEKFTRIHEKINGQLQIGDKSMKYIITKKEKDSFEAIPHFEEGTDSFVTFVFDKE